MKTFEEIDAHVKGCKHLPLPKTKEEAVINLCGYYASVRSILVFLGDIAFLPEAWKVAINGLVVTLDLMCPQHK